MPRCIAAVRAVGARYARSALVVVCLVFVACAVGVLEIPHAFAGPPANGGEVEGVVVQVNQGELVIDLGSDAGLRDAMEVEIFRRLEVKHPVTGQVIVDRFLIGDVKLERVGKLLSIAKVYSHLERPPAVGDFVVFVRGDAAATEKKGEDVAGDGVVAAVDPEQEELNAAFQATLGRPLDERVHVWGAYLKAHPKNDYTEQVVAEVLWLRHQIEAERERPPKVTPKKLEALTVKTAISNQALEGEPIEVYAAVVEREKVEAVRALARTQGVLGFTAIPMQRDGDFGWRTTLDSPWNHPGVVEFFIEAIRKDGTTELVLGSASAPVLVDVLSVAHDRPDERDRSRATMTFDYVDFWIPGGGKDAYLRFESDYRYTIGSRWLSTIAVGVGVFDGSGGSLVGLEVDDVVQVRNISYGSMELGFDFGEYVGLTTRISFGNGRRDENAEREAIFGFRGALRIGRDNGTRLIVGGNFTEDIGNEGWVEFVLEEIKNIPIHAAVVATNLPVGEDVGVSLNGGVGYRVNPLFTVMARVGWNARTINHWGLTGGVSAVLNW